MIPTRLKASFVGCSTWLLPLKPSMSAARRCSSSSSTQRYSRSHTRDRHSRSHCCSTAEGHGSWTLYPSAKLVFFLRTRLAYGEKREREQPFGSPSVAFFKIFSLYVVRFFRNTTAPLKASRTPPAAYEYDPAHRPAPAHPPTPRPLSHGPGGGPLRPGPPQASLSRLPGSRGIWIGGNSQEYKNEK